MQVGTPVRHIDGTNMKTNKPDLTHLQAAAESTLAAARANPSAETRAAAVAAGDLQHGCVAIILDVGVILAVEVGILLRRHMPAAAPIFTVAT